MIPQWIVAGLSVYTFVCVAFGWWLGSREVRDTRVILTKEEEVTALSRRTRRAF